MKLIHLSWQENDGKFENYYTYWDPTIRTKEAYATVSATGFNSAGKAMSVDIQGSIHFLTNFSSRHLREELR
jgi:hypothetical protein